MQDGQCTVCNRSFHLIEFCQQEVEAWKVLTCIEPEMLSLSLRISWRFFVPKMFRRVVCASNLKRSFGYRERIWHVSVIAGGPKPRLDFSHKIRVGRWSLGAGVENSNHYDLFGIFWTHLGKACKPDHQISDMNVSKSFFKHQFTLITARFARILLSFPLFVGNSLWLV